MKHQAIALAMAIYPAENGKVGTSEFMIQIDELK